MNVTVLGAIFRRDFISYFSNPTGYVFICVFVMLCSLAAFWPPDFFNNNLANLDQLSRWMPFILLVFVPAITMSTWAEERRQGTDELLLTMPATDFDVVLGKYLAALAIYTVSLLFGMFSIYLVFAYGLGQPDWGLFACTFLGYWLVGGALLSIGMVASFLTRNLTVGFVLGMLFIAPFALAGVADWIVKEPGTAQLISRWSVANQFSDFARGVVSLSGVSYFIILTVVMLYLCMVLIGRRHWGTGEEGDSRWAHYFGRFAALLLIAGGLNVILSNYDQRADATQERINSLSDRTRQMMKSLADDDDVKPINVEVFVSPKVPSEYASHKLDLLGTLREIQSLTDGKVQAKIYQIENFSPEAQTAEQSYGIQPQLVNAMVRGRPAREEIMMGMAITSGLDKVVVPFVDKGIPPEYELVRSIMTVAETKRKRVGVLTTGVNLFEEFSMQGQVPQSQLITELEKQYDVVQVDPREPIVDSYDVLLAVQPSQLTPEALTNFLDYIKRGQPVAIFEDPAPTPLMPGAVATGAPNVQGGGMMAMFGGGGQEIPKGDIAQLWKLLGVRLLGGGTSLLGTPNRYSVVLQRFNPYYQFEYAIGEQFVFVDEVLAASEDVTPFNPENPISAGLRQVLFLRPGALLNDEAPNREATALVSTGRRTITAPFTALERVDLAAQLAIEEQEFTGESYVMAMAVEGDIESDEDLSLKLPQQAEQTDKSKDDVPLAKQKLKAVVVADIDCLSDAFFTIRAQGEQDMGAASFTFQNVSLVLNILDWLAGDDRYIAIRKRTKAHRVLEGIESETAQYRTVFQEVQEQANADYEKAVEEARSELTTAINKLEEQTNLDSRERAFREQQIRARIGAKVENRVKQLENEREKKVRLAQLTLEQQISGEQNKFKRLAVLLPPIPPILLGLYVYFHRRNRERQGVSKRRLRFLSEDDKATAAKVEHS